MIDAALVQTLYEVTSPSKLETLTIAVARSEPVALPDSAGVGKSLEIWRGTEYLVSTLEGLLEMVHALQRPPFSGLRELHLDFHELLLEAEVAQTVERHVGSLTSKVLCGRLQLHCRF